MMNLYIEVVSLIYLYIDVVSHRDLYIEAVSFRYPYIEAISQTGRCNTPTSHHTLYPFWKHVFLSKLSIVQTSSLAGF